MSNCDETEATMLQARLTRRYLDLVKDLYTGPTEERVVKNPLISLSRCRSQLSHRKPQLKER